MQVQIEFSFGSPSHPLLVRGKQSVPGIPYHAVPAGNCRAVPASSQHIRLKNLGAITGGKRKTENRFAEACFTSAGQHSAAAH